MYIPVIRGFLVRKCSGDVDLLNSTMKLEGTKVTYPISTDLLMSLVSVFIGYFCNWSPFLRESLGAFSLVFNL